MLPHLNDIVRIWGKEHEIIVPSCLKCFRLVVACRTFRPLSTTAYLKMKSKLKKTVKYNEKKIKKLRKKTKKNAKL